jgi:DNA-binding transcriptional LysR family regulator
MHAMKLEKLDFNLLPILDAVLSTESVTKAAVIVGLSKPAASHALSRIRQQLGDPILVRAGQRWVLTERASAIAARVHATVIEARTLLSPNRPFDPSELRREFRVHATDQVLSIIGLAVGHAVSEEAPDVVLRFVPPKLDEAAALRSDADLSLGVFDDLPPEIRTQKLFDDRFACIVREGHPRVRGKLSLETFVALRHVSLAPRGRPGSVVDAALAERGLARRAVRWVPYAASAIEFVADSDWIATVGERFARKLAQRYALQVLEPPIPLPRYDASQVWHSRLEADPAHGWLRRLIARVTHKLETDRRRARTKQS